MSRLKWLNCFTCLFVSMSDKGTKTLYRVLLDDQYEFNTYNIICMKISSLRFFCTTHSKRNMWVFCIARVVTYSTK